MKKFFVIVLGLVGLRTLAQPATKILEFRFEIMPGGTSTAAPYYVNPLVLSSASNMTYGPGLNGSVGFTAGTNNLPDLALWADSWNTTAFDANDYYSWTETGVLGYTVVHDSIIIYARRSSTGPTNVQLRSSITAYATTLWVGVSGGTNVWKKHKITTGLPSFTGSMSFRFYSYIASASAGTLRIDSVKVYGHLLDVFNLPIELTSFDAKADLDRVKLNWTTATEHDNNYFTIYRSQDTENWEEVGITPGAGTSLSELYYELFDEDPQTGISYYKLRQTDFDGAWSESDIRAVIFRRITSFNFKLNEEVSWNDQPTALFDVSGRQLSTLKTRHIMSEIGIFFLRTEEGEAAKLIITE